MVCVNHIFLGMAALTSWASVLELHLVLGS